MDSDAAPIASSKNITILINEKYSSRIFLKQFKESVASWTRGKKTVLLLFHKILLYQVAEMCG